MLNTLDIFMKTHGHVNDAHTYYKSFLETHGQYANHAHTRLKSWKSFLENIHAYICLKSFFWKHIANITTMSIHTKYYENLF